ncbi:unnamed protein product [Protopolystoma xenopodis]|uniref:Uncharacterized protein n=1 Tax=Protopolystoma xenopodis TaxID=117903 RepID=A0A3S5BPX1_9PLAT|nr:unnamed protein product [Protopolystoma xenopodis]
MLLACIQRLVASRCSGKQTPRIAHLIALAGLSTLCSTKPHVETPDARGLESAANLGLPDPSTRQQNEWRHVWWEGRTPAVNPSSVGSEQLGRREEAFVTASHSMQVRQVYGLRRVEGVRMLTAPEAEGGLPRSCDCGFVQTSPRITVDFRSSFDRHHRSRTLCFTMIH